MATDPDRAAFIQHEYRYHESEDTAVGTTYANARSIVINTNLDESTATTRATGLLSAMNHVQQCYEVEIEGVYTVEDLVTSPPRFQCSFAEFSTDSRVFWLASIDADPMANRTVLVIYG